MYDSILPKNSFTSQKSPWEQHSGKFYNGGYFAELDTLSLKLTYTNKERKVVIKYESEVESPFTRSAMAMKIQWSISTVRKNRPRHDAGQ